MFRKIMIFCILATDMSRHFTDIEKAKGRLTASINPIYKIKMFS